MFVNQTGMGQARMLPLRRPIPVPRFRVFRGGRGMGQALLLRPGPGDVGTEVVDVNGNIVYSADQVAANPALANISGGGCPAGMVPTWYPGGQSQCAVPGAQGGTYIAGAPIGQCDDPSGLCQGSTFQGQVIQTPVQLEAIPQGLPSSFLPLSPVGVMVGDRPIPTSVNFQNTSRPGQSLQVGDSWKISITGMPGSPVTAASVQNGASLGTSNYGSTDSSGNFSLTGTADASTVGNWSESWAVAGVAGPTLNFTVSAAAAASGGPPSGGSAGAPAGSPGPVASLPPATTAAPGCFSLVGALGIPDPCIGPLPIGITTLAALIGGFFLLSSMGGRR